MSLKGSFFDSSDDSEDSKEGVIDNPTQDDLNIPMLDLEDGDKTDEEEEEDKPAPKTKKSLKADKPDDEDEEEEETQDDPKDKEDPKDEEDDNESPFEILATSLIEKAAFIPKEGKDYDDSEEGILELVNDTVEARIKSKVIEGYDSILDAMELGIPAQEWVAQVTPVDYENADLTDEDTQEYLVREALKVQGLKEDKIEKKVASYKKLETLAEEAEDAQEILVEKEQERIAAYQESIKTAKVNAEKEQKQRIEKIYKEIDDTKEIAGFTLSNKEQKELKDYITKPVNGKGETQYMIDRNHPDKLVKNAYFAMKGVDVKKLTKVAESKATSSLRDKLSAATDRQSSGKGKTAKEKINTKPSSVGLSWLDGNREVEDDY
jgi:hypothetical protein